jgi:hypothetical protein
MVQENRQKPTGAQAGAMARNGSTRPWAILATARSLKGAAPAPCVARNGRDEARLTYPDPALHIATRREP